MPEKLKPIFIKNRSESHLFTTPPLGGGGNENYPERRRQEHSQKLISQYIDILNEYDNQQNVLNVNAQNSGMYLEFIAQEKYPLTSSPLDSPSKGIRLLNIHDDNEILKATVFVPNEHREYFLEKIRAYKDKDTRFGKPENEKLVVTIEEICLATVRSFWTCINCEIPSTSKVWVEAWLCNQDNQHIEDVEAEINQLSELYNIQMKSTQLIFPERIIKMLHVNYQDLVNLAKSCSYLSEFRPATTLTSFWNNLDSDQQIEWSEELIERCTIDLSSNISVGILDSGVNNGHILLKDFLEDRNKHTYDPSWSVDDIEGHGTMMSGLAVYGDLASHLDSVQPIYINYNLCSCKIYPNTSNAKELWGHITSQAVSKIEIENANNKHIFCMAVTADDYSYQGMPSSWSSEIDRICYEEENRLFIVSAGNMNEGLLHTYPEGIKTNENQNPAQSWNALTIGAYTKLVGFEPEDDSYLDYKCLAEAGDLSPFTTTSRLWDNQWPNKPDVVFEGGNALINSLNFVTEHPDLSLISTYHLPHIKSFDWINKTSAATGLATNFTAKLYSEFPNAWPETIRALVVHSAQWTENMVNQCRVGITRPGELYKNLLRSCGYGIPSFDRAVNCYKNSLTLISENTLKPYYKEDNKGNPKTFEMNFYDLPWPKEVLLSLDADVQMRVTLSYYIDAGPSELASRKLTRYNYSSHGLRFDINHPLETKEQFIERKNKAARDSDEDYETSGFSSRDFWVLGVNNRNRGSVISDIWEGKATDLATCNFISVYPIGGWWKERKNLEAYDNHAKYSLIVSIYSPEENIDIYTPVKNIIEIPISIPVEL